MADRKMGTHKFGKLKRNTTFRLAILFGATVGTFVLFYIPSGELGKSLFYTLFVHVFVLLILFGRPSGPSWPW